MNAATTWTIDITDVNGDGPFRYVAAGDTAACAQGFATAYHVALGPGTTDRLTRVRLGDGPAGGARDLRAYQGKRAETEAAVMGLLPGAYASTRHLPPTATCMVCPADGVTGTAGRPGWTWYGPAGSSTPDCGSHGAQGIVAAITLADVEPAARALGAFVAAVDTYAQSYVHDADPAPAGAMCGVCGHPAMWAVETGSCVTVFACGIRHTHDEYQAGINAALGDCGCDDCAATIAAAAPMMRPA